MHMSLKQEISTGSRPRGLYTEGGIYEVNCISGFRWSDGFFVKYVNCTESNWTAFPVSCQGAEQCLL